jgi:hypothetical protein
LTAVASVSAGTGSRLAGGTIVRARAAGEHEYEREGEVAATGHGAAQPTARGGESEPYKNTKPLRPQRHLCDV